MSINLVQQDELHGIMPPLINPQQQSAYPHHHTGEEYGMVNHMESPSILPFSPSRHPTHHYNDQDQYPSYEEFDAIVQDYLQNLSSKKRDKALIDQARYAMILQVLKDPRNTAVSTAQFRFWVKKMFQLTPRQMVCHDGKPVAMREQIYGILVRAHREAHHGGRDKTSALVRRRYSWIPKELIARFVRHCPFCISRRNGSQQSPLSLGIFLPTTPPSYSVVSSEDRQRAPSMITSASTASTASYPDEMMMMAAATQRHQQQQQHSNQEGQASMSPYGSGAIDLSWQSSSPNSGNHHYYAPSQQTSNNGHPAMFSPSISNSGSGNNCYQTARPYSVGYSQSSDIENSQPMAMQPPLSVYYPHDYGLKQNSVYSIMDANNMTFVTPYNNTNVRSNENMLFAPNSGNDSMGAIKTEDIGLKNPSPCCYGQQNGVAPSPSLSPSSSSTSTSSSPVHPAYHESTSNHDSYIPQQRQNSQQTPQSVHSPALNLLSHNHQPLF